MSLSKCASIDRRSRGGHPVAATPADVAVRLERGVLEELSRADAGNRQTRNSVCPRPSIFKKWFGGRERTCDPRTVHTEVCTAGEISAAPGSDPGFRVIGEPCREELDVRNCVAGRPSLHNGSERSRCVVVPGIVVLSAREISWRSVMCLGGCGRWWRWRFGGRARCRISRRRRRTRPVRWCRRSALGGGSSEWGNSSSVWGGLQHGLLVVGPGSRCAASRDVDVRVYSRHMTCAGGDGADEHQDSCRVSTSVSPRMCSPEGARGAAMGHCAR